jgi:hypothetical protein
MVVNDIVNGISVQLNTVFGDGYGIHTENVKQGLIEPCFFIKLLTTISTPFMGKRKKREYPFDIHYLPENDADNDGMYSVGDKLMESMEYITLLDGNILRGKDMTYEIIDGVLHFKVTYAVVLNDISREGAMDEYGLDLGVKE